MSPFRVGPEAPRLTTPEWYGEPGVDAVIILSIDDLSGNTPRYVEMLAPILDRLQAVEGSSPLGIFTCSASPTDPAVRALAERGVRFDVHTRTHPCPLLSKGLAGARGEVLDCLDQLFRLPGPGPIAFRMPCCDSINSASPACFGEILPRESAEGRWLQADSSVLSFPAPDFRRYAPFQRYAATVEAYPFPYVVGESLWELPIIAPSDWQAQNLRGPNRPETVEDWKRALDLTVSARGVYTLCFHPHGWIKNSQVVELIDHAVRTHGRRVRFTTFHDVVERLTANFLGGCPLRLADGTPGDVQVLDVDGDGFEDVVIGGVSRRETRLWDSGSERLRVLPFPFQLHISPPAAQAARGAPPVRRARFGVLEPGGRASVLVLDGEERALAHFDGENWARCPSTALGALEVGGKPVATVRQGLDGGVRFHDVDGDGVSELLVSNPDQNAAFRWLHDEGRFVKLPWSLPRPASLAGARGEDRGLLLADLDLDGRKDVVLSNEDEFHVALFTGADRGWSRRLLGGAAGGPGALPLLSRGGENRGGWIQGRVLYVANEDTVGKTGLVETRDLALLVEHGATEPPSPAEAVQAIEAPSGFTVEVFAAEPLIQDPVALDFGPDGRVWVIEMGGYPLGITSGPTSRVKLLEDANRDGTIDRAVVFSDLPGFATGVLAYGRGALVTCAPDILYLEDRDGDGREDLRRVVLTGFGEGNQQHRVNGLHLGIDNWIHGANGDSGGRIVRPGDEAWSPVALGGRDFRISLDLRSLQPDTGHTQFGLTLDEDGRRFGSSNARHLLHSVIPDRFLARNPSWSPPDAVIDLPEHGGMAAIFQRSRQLLSLNEIHVPGHFSSACGLAIDTGSQLPAPFAGSIFVCEPVGNLIHRDVLVERGSTVSAVRGDPGREFLASTSTWFRPVGCVFGPDGALYVIDLCRWVIEHPAYIPPGIQELLDFDAGRDLGRIYRVSWTGEGNTRSPQTPRGPPDLDRRSAAELAALLEHPIGWWRSAAQGELVAGAHREAAPVLRKLLRESRSDAARSRALWALEGLGVLEPADILAASQDASPRVRVHALRTLEGRVAQDRTLELRLLECARDPSPRVRLEAALQLGGTGSAGAAAALATLLREDQDDRWIRTAALSSAAPHAGALLERLFGAGEAPPPSSGWKEVFRALTSTALASGSAGSVLKGLEETPAEKATPWHVLLVSLADDLARSRRLPDGVYQGVRARALEVARGTSPIEERVEAIGALGPLLTGDGAQLLLEASQPPGVTLAAVVQLGRRARAGDSRSAATLLAAWPGLAPTPRLEALEALSSSTEGATALLEAVEANFVRAADLGTRLRERIASLEGGKLAARAGALLSSPPPENRAGVVARALELARQGARSPERGRAVFHEHCSPCHQLEGDGHEVGPDLSASNLKGDAELLEAILNPGGVVPPRYRAYELETERGVVTGVIVSETAAALTLRRAGGVEETVPRSEVRGLRSSSEPLMPVGLERTIPPASLGDLLSFLGDQPIDLAAVTPELALAERAHGLEELTSGLSEVIAHRGEAEQASAWGVVRMAYIRQLDGEGELAWRTRPIQPASPDPGRCLLKLPVAMGYQSQPAGSFTLFLGQEKLLDLDVTLSSRSWASPNGEVRVFFKVLARNAEDATGVLTLELPTSRLEPGKPALLRVKGSASNSRRWLGVLKLQDQP